MDAELDDEETLWAAEEELRAAQLMIEQAQRNRAEAAQLCTASAAARACRAGTPTLARSQESTRRRCGASTRSCSRSSGAPTSSCANLRSGGAAAAAGERELELLAADHAATARAARGLRRWRRASQRAAGRQVERSAALWWRDGALGAALRYWARRPARARRRARVRGARQPAVGVGAAPVAAARARRHPPRPRARPPRRRVLANGRRWRRRTPRSAGGAIGGGSCCAAPPSALRYLACASRSAACAATRGGGTRRATLVLWLLRRVGNALRAWTTMVMRRIEATMRPRRALASWMLRAAAAALRSWYEEARLGRAMRAVALGLRHRGLRAAVNGWRGVTDTRRDTLSRLSRAGGALLQKELRAAYVRWAVAAARASSIAELLHFAVLRWLGRRVGAAWRRWAAAAAAGLAAEMSLRRVLGYWHFSRMATAWRTWRAAAATDGGGAWRARARGRAVGRRRRRLCPLPVAAEHGAADGGVDGGGAVDTARAGGGTRPLAPPRATARR